MAKKRRRNEYEQRSDAVRDFDSGRSLLRHSESPAASDAEGASSNAANAKPDTNNTTGIGGTVHHKTKKQKIAPKAHKESLPLIHHSPTCRLNAAVKISDLQQLILYILANDKSPQWIAVRNHRGIKKVVVLMVPGLEIGMFNGDLQLNPPAFPPSQPTSTPDRNGKQKGTMHSTSASNGTLGAEAANVPSSSRSIHLSPDDYYPVKLEYDELPQSLKPLADMFTHIWPVRAPGDDKMTRLFSPFHAMLQAPYPKTEEERNTKGPLMPVSARKHFDNKRTPITHFIAGLEELTENGYVLHPAFATTETAKDKLLEKRERDLHTSSHGWADTSIQNLEEAEVPGEEIQSGSILLGRNVLSVDCEFCKTVDGEFAVTRVSIVDWDGTTVMDELVKPDKPIADYLTTYSGITKEKLESVTTTLSDIQKRLLDTITPRTVLMGHSLESDLKALKMTHPFIVDTALIFPHPRGPPQKQALRFLVKRYLGREIQNHGLKGHNSIEDAVAVLDLVKQKCERGPLWGSTGGTSEPVFKRLKRTPKHSNGNGDGEAVEYRKGAIIDWGNPSIGPGGTADVVVGCNSDVDVVEGVKRAVVGEATDADAAPLDIDLIFGRLRELEAIRGWWTPSKTNALDDLRQAVFSRLSASDPEIDATAPDPATLTKAVAQTVDNIANIHASLPQDTAFIVFSGHGDAREITRLNALQQQFKREYETKKWDELTIRWTDAEAQGLREAIKRARQGVGFVVIK
jgi:RNA exonuclease 1